MSFVNTFKTSSYKIVIALLIFNFISWLSIFLYGMFYYLYIPPVDHVRPVHFQFDSICKNYTGCHFPFSTVPLPLRGQYQLLSRGQRYMVLLELEMPESEPNRHIGMFMIKANMTTKDGDVLRSSSRPAIMHYKSWISRMIQSLFYSPFLFSGTYEEKQTVSVVLFENYEESPASVTSLVVLEVQNPKIEIYTSLLKIHATFTGLRYYMFYWPLMTGFVGVSTIFFFLSLVALFAWYHYTANSANAGDLQTYFPPPPHSSDSGSSFDSSFSTKSEGFEQMAPDQSDDVVEAMPPAQLASRGDGEIRRRVQHLISQNPPGDFRTHALSSMDKSTSVKEPEELSDKNVLAFAFYLLKALATEYLTLIQDAAAGILHAVRVR